MITVKPEVIDNIRGIIERCGGSDKVVDKMMSEIREENKPLAEAIESQAFDLAERLAYDDEQQERIYVNLIYSMVAVYKTIKVQTEVDELENIYGK